MSLFEPREKPQERMATIKFVNSFRKKHQISGRNVPKLLETSSFQTRKELKKDRDPKISSPGGQIDRKNRKHKIKLLLK